MVEEEQIPQAVGGHMRLIIGYNSIANEVLYSDSWGLGHEEKRMSLDDAWTMTNAQQLAADFLMAWVRTFLGLSFSGDSFQVR